MVQHDDVHAQVAGQRDLAQRGRTGVHRQQQGHAAVGPLPDHPPRHAVAVGRAIGNEGRLAADPGSVDAQGAESLEQQSAAGDAVHVEVAMHGHALAVTRGLPHALDGAIHFSQFERVVELVQRRVEEPLEFAGAGHPPGGQHAQKAVRDRHVERHLAAHGGQHRFVDRHTAAPRPSGEHADRLRLLKGFILRITHACSLPVRLQVDSRP